MNYQYTVLTANRSLRALRSNELRDSLIAKLEQASIGYGIYYPVPVHQQRPFKQYSKEKYPEAERAAGEVVSIPVHPLLARKYLDAVVKALKT